MGEAAVWWQQHRMLPPPRTPDMRYAVKRYAWGVAVWEGPTRSAPTAPTRIADVVVTSPGAPADLGYELALDRMPNPGAARRIARAMPFATTPRAVRAAGIVLALVLVVATSTGTPALLLSLVALLPLALVLAERLPPHHHVGAWRRAGHDAAAIGFSGQVVLADAICERAHVRRHPHVEQLGRAVRHALWTCRQDGTGSPGRLNRWLVDIARADHLAVEIASCGAEARRAERAGGPSTVLVRAAALAPAMVGAMTTPVDEQRADVLDQLRRLRDACREAHAARIALERTVDAEEQAPGAGRGVPEHLAEARREEVGALLRELTEESQILREVDAELRSRDGGPDPGTP